MVSDFSSCFYSATLHYGGWPPGISLPRRCKVAIARPAKKQRVIALKVVSSCTEGSERFLDCGRDTLFESRSLPIPNVSLAEPKRKVFGMESQCFPGQN